MMTPFSALSLNRWPWFALIASALLLAAAHAFETFGHLAPCTLCLRQREAHWAVLTIAAVGIGISFTPLANLCYRWICLALAVAFAYSTYMGAFHTGVEFHWWPGPTTCASTTATNTVTAEAMARMLGGGRIRAPACDVAVWYFAGLSMAAWNGLISVGLMAASILSAWRGGAQQ